MHFLLTVAAKRHYAPGQIFVVNVADASRKISV